VLARRNRWGRSGPRSWLCSQKCQAATPAWTTVPASTTASPRFLGAPDHRGGRCGHEDQRASPHHRVGLELVDGSLELLIRGVPGEVHEPSGDEDESPEGEQAPGQQTFRGENDRQQRSEQHRADGTAPIIRFVSYLPTPPPLVGRLAGVRRGSQAGRCSRRPETLPLPDVARAMR